MLEYDAFTKLVSCGDSSIMFMPNFGKFWYFYIKKKIIIKENNFTLKIIKKWSVWAVCPTVNIVVRSGPLVPSCRKWPTLLDLGTSKGT